MPFSNTEIATQKSIHGTVKERPILFSAEMVRALLDGRKTMTRRVAKVETCDTRPLGGGNVFITPRGCYSPRTPEEHIQYCPYGQPGDRLWVRERMRAVDLVNHGSKVAAIRLKYEADNAESDFIEYPERLDGTPVVGRCLACGGFREASRILLEITNVRVERVQEISEEDAKAEGSEWIRCMDDKECLRCYGCGFHALWDSINAKRGFGWDVNPWVWVVEFQRI
jgi:hypothetical protein